MFIHFYRLFMCTLILNIQLIVCNFCAKICDLIKNHVHHGKNQPRQEVEDGYIVVNNFVKNNLYVISIVYGVALFRHTVAIVLLPNQYYLVIKFIWTRTHTHRHAYRQYILYQSHYSSSILASVVYFSRFSIDSLCDYILVESILLMASPSHPNILGVFLSPCRHFYVSTESSKDFLRLELDTLHIINFTWVCTKVCSYKYSQR